MNNLDKLVQVIREHDAYGTCHEPECLAQDIADAGLLTPDLPEPEEKFTTGDASWTLVGKAAVDSWRDEGGPVVALMAGRGRYLIPAEARQLAYILLAAADYAEEKPSLGALPLLSPPTVEEENTIRQKYRLPPKPDRTWGDQP